MTQCSCIIWVLKQWSKMCLSTYEEFLREWKVSLLYYHNVAVGKGQVVVLGWGGCREHYSMSVPEEEVSQWAGQQEMAGTHLHTFARGHTQKHSCTWSRCNLQWQRQAGLGIGPLGVVITVFPLWPCECSRAWAHVCCVINSVLIHHDKMCVLVCAGLLLSHSLLPSACRTGSQGEKLGLCVCVCVCALLNH